MASEGIGLFFGKSSLEESILRNGRVSNLSFFCLWSDVSSHAIQLAKPHHFGLIFVGRREDHGLGCEVTGLSKGLSEGIVRCFSLRVDRTSEVEGEVRRLRGFGIW